MVRGRQKQRPTDAGANAGKTSGRADQANRPVTLKQPVTLVDLADVYGTSTFEWVFPRVMVAHSDVDKFISWCRRVRFDGFPIPLTLMASRDHLVHAVWISVSMRVKPIHDESYRWNDQDRLVSLVANGPRISATAMVGDGRAAKEQALQFVRDVVAHELLEWTLVDGVREFDPHDPIRSPKWQTV